MIPPMMNASGRTKAFWGTMWLALSGATSGFAALGCAGATTATAVPNATVEAELIVDHYRSDARLGDDLYNDKVVEITAFRVDEVGDGDVTMKDRGWSLRLRGVAKERAKAGETFVAVCEGDGLDGEQVIVFEGCLVR